MVLKNQISEESQLKITLQPEEELQLTNFFTNYRCLGYSREQLLSMTLQEVLRASIALLEKQVVLKQCGAVQSQLIPEILPAAPTMPADSQSIFLYTQPAALLTEIFQFIETNYHQPITLSDVAKAVGYSPAYLTDLVRRQTGKTVYRWIVERRIAQACFLLLETDRTVEQIATAVGYHDAGYFFRVFRQWHNTTPQAWRKAQRTGYHAGHFKEP